MENKLQIIETPDYILAVSDEEIKKGNLAYKIEYSHTSCFYVNSEELADDYNRNSDNFKKIIAYQPKGNAPELDLPLLPEIVVEDGVDFAKMFYVLLKQTYPTFDEWVEAKEYLKHKSATKRFSEEDLRKAIKMAWEADSIDGTVDLNIVLHYGNNNDLRTKWSENEIIQFLKQPKTPKWFVAETELKEVNPNADRIQYLKCLKTTIINDKKYLAGTYLYE